MSRLLVVTQKGVRFDYNCGVAYAVGQVAFTRFTVGSVARVFNWSFGYARECPNTPFSEEVRGWNIGKCAPLRKKKLKEIL